MARKLYMSRSAAIAGARRAAKKALGPVFEAYEGPDFAIHPTSDPDAQLYTKRGNIDMGDRWFFELRGPALEAST